ncbi:MAG: glycosyltransferase [Dehalococcoidia bacterium]
MKKATLLRIIARMNVGGPAQEIVGLLDGIDHERYQQFLAVGRVDAGEEDWFHLRAPELADDPRIVPVAALGRPISPRADLRAYRELRSLIREIRPDIVHTHTAKAGVVGRLAAIHERVPAIVHTYHGHVLEGYFNAGVTAVVRTIERRLARRTNALLAGGSTVRDDLLAAGVGDTGQYTVVPPGVAPVEVADPAEVRHRWEIPKEAPVVAFIGRLAGVKRPDRFLEVADAIADSRPETIFLVAGGAEPRDLDRLGSMVQKADVRFLGWVADVGAVHAASDLVLLTSDNEGMPVSLIEAGMSGLPCVATKVGSVSDVVIDKQTGRVVSTDVDELVCASLELLEDRPRRERYGVAARDHTLHNFGMSRLVSTVESIYEGILDLPQ